MSTPEAADTFTDADLLASDPQFSISLALGRGCIRVCARGEVDLATRDELSEAGLRALEQPTVGEVVIDLANVSFLDASGLGSLVAIRNASGARGKSLVLTNIPNRVARLLELTDLSRHFTVAAQPSTTSPAGRPRHERPSMSTSAPDGDQNGTKTPDAGTPADRQAGTDPRVTAHPTGRKQAAKNAENEPAG